MLGQFIYDQQQTALKLVDFFDGHCFPPVSRVPWLYQLQAGL